MDFRIEKTSLEHDRIEKLFLILGEKLLSAINFFQPLKLEITLTLT